MKNGNNLKLCLFEKEIVYNSVELDSTLHIHYRSGLSGCFAFKLQLNTIAYLTCQTVFIAHVIAVSDLHSHTDWGLAHWPPRQKRHTKNMHKNKQKQKKETFTNQNKQMLQCSFLRIINFFRMPVRDWVIEHHVCFIMPISTVTDITKKFS